MKQEIHLDHPIEAQASFQGWMVCLVAALFFFYEFVQLMMFNSINASLMADFHITGSAVGKISSGYFIANILFMFPAGILLDRFSTRRIILTAMLLCVIGTVLFSFSTNVDGAMACRFLTGIGGSFPFLCCLRLLSRWFPPRSWAFVSGIVVTIAFLGGVVGQTPMTFLVTYFGWRHALQIDAVFGVGFIFLIYSVVQDHPKHQQSFFDQLPNIHLGLAVKNAISNRQNWFYGLYTSMINLPVMLLGAIWGNLYLVQVFGLTATKASLVTSMIFFGTIVGSPLLGGLSDYLGRRKWPMLVCGILTLFFILYIMYASHLSFIYLMVLFFILGFITSAQIISYPAISESNPHEMSASSLGLASVLIMGTPAIFQPLFGKLIDWGWQGKLINGVPFYTAQDFHRALLILPIAAVFGIVMILLAKETYCRINDR